MSIKRVFNLKSGQKVRFYSWLPAVAVPEKDIAFFSEPG